MAKELTAEERAEIDRCIGEAIGGRLINPLVYSQPIADSCDTEPGILHRPPPERIG